MYELVALIYPHNGLIHYYSQGPLKSLGVNSEKDYYIDSGKLAGRFIAPEYREKAAKMLAFENIISRLDEAGEYSLILPVEYNEKRFWKKWGFYWLSEDKSAIIMICSDVTNLEDLRNLNADMRFALQTTGIIICHYDVKKRTLTLPDAYAVSVGLPNVIEDVPYAAANVAERYKDDYIKFYERILAGEEQGESTIQFALANGRTRWGLCSFRTVFDDDGAPKSAVVTISDITKQRERDIENQRNRILAEQNGIAIVDYDFINDVLYFEGSRADKGYVKKALPGYYDYIGSAVDATPEGAQAIRAMLREAVKRPTNGTLDFTANVWATGYRWVRLDYSTLADESGKVYRLLGQVRDIQKEHERDELLAKLGKRIGDNFPVYTYDPTLLSQIFQFLYGTSDMDDAINRVLALLGEYYHASRAYICEDDDTHSISRNTFEWCAEGIESQKDKLQNVSYDENLHGEYAGLFGEDNICVCPDISLLPDAVRKHLEAQGVKGIVMCNILDNGRAFGMVGFDDCTGNMAWTDEQTGTLALASIILGTFLIKRRQQENAVLSGDFIAALDDSASYIYIVHPDTYEVIYYNRALRERFPDTPIGCSCYEAAIGRLTPCENCSVRILQETGISQPVEALRKDGIWMLSQASRIHWKGLDAYMVSCTDITAQKRMEEELRVSGKEREIVIRQSGKYVFIYDIRTGTANNLVDAFELLRLPKVVEDYENAIIRDGVVCPESVETCRAFFRDIRNGKPSDCIELRLRNSDNRKRWYRVDSTTVFKDGEPDHAVISFYDCTDERERERLSQVQRALADVVSNISGGVYCYSFGDETKLEYVSDALCEMLGSNKDELLYIFSGDCADGVFEDDLDLFASVHERLRESPQTITFEYRVKRKDGTPCWVSDTVRSIRRDDGIMMAYGAVTQIDAERTAQMQFRALTNSVPGGIIMYEYADNKLSMQYFNDTLCRITGYSREEYQRMAEADPLVLVYEEDIPALLLALEQIISTGRQLEHEYRISTAYGFCWIHITAEIIERTGDTFKLIAVLMDVSERKEAEAAVKFRDYCLNLVDTALSAGTIINGLGLNAPLYHVSENIEKLLGYSVEEFKAMYAEQYERIIYPEDYPRVLELNEKYAREQPAYFEMEFRFIRKDGSVFWTLERATKLEDFQGGTAYLSVFVDITQQKAIQEQINIQEESYRIAIAHANSIVYRFDIASKAIYMPPEVAATYGLPSRIENIPHSVVQAGYVAPESADAYIDFYQSIASGVEGKNVEIRRLLPDGKFHWFRGEYTIIVGKDGTPKSAIVTFTDINEQKDKDEEISALKEKEQLLKVIARNTQKRIIIYDFATDTLRPYDNTDELFINSEIKSFRPQDYFSEAMVAPECIDAMKTEYAKLLAGIPEGGLKCRMRLSDGVWRWYNGAFTTIFDASGKPNYSVFSLDDITDAYEKELTFQRYQNMMVAMNISQSFYLEYNLTTNTLESYSENSDMPEYINTAKKGYDDGIRYIGENLVYAPDKEAYYELMDIERVLASFAAGNSHNSADIRLKLAPDSEPVYVRMNYQMVLDPHTSDKRILFICRFVDEEVREQMELKNRAQIDPVTNLYNRATFIEMVQERIARATDDLLHAFVMLDVDHFKKVNDTFGHSVGDKVLHDVAYTIRSVLFKDDIVGRLGGDEFGMLISDFPDIKTLTKKLEILCTAVFRELEGKVKISASLGVALLPKNGTTFEELYEKADIALYQVKQNGRDHFMFYSDDMKGTVFNSMLSSIDENPGDKDRGGTQ
ncbi:MAG: PAS domain S-box protein [Clostridia bacterium]|nr:PAS domain S-box protein [Clostridia bacterium]